MSPLNHILTHIRDTNGAKINGPHSEFIGLNGNTLRESDSDTDFDNDSDNGAESTTFKVLSLARGIVIIESLL